MFVCLKSSNIEGNAGRSASDLVSLNNNIFHYIVRCFNREFNGELLRKFS